jgi:hypothetical protein
LLSGNLTLGWVKEMASKDDTLFQSQGIKRNAELDQQVVGSVTTFTLTTFAQFNIETVDAFVIDGTQRSFAGMTGKNSRRSLDGTTNCLSDCKAKKRWMRSLSLRNSLFQVFLTSNANELKVLRKLGKHRSNFVGKQRKSNIVLHCHTAQFILVLNLQDQTHFCRKAIAQLS